MPLLLDNLACLFVRRTARRAIDAHRCFTCGGLLVMLILSTGCCACRFPAGTSGRMTRAIIHHARQGDLCKAIREGHIAGLSGPLPPADMLVLYETALRETEPHVSSRPTYNAGSYEQWLMLHYDPVSKSLRFHREIEPLDPERLLFRSYYPTARLFEEAGADTTDDSAPREGESLQAFAERNGVTFPAGARFVSGNTDSRISLWNTQENHARFESLLKARGWFQRRTTSLDDSTSAGGGYEFYTLQVEVSARQNDEAISDCATRYLLKALKMRNRAFVLVLLDLGADPNTQQEDSWPLLEAVYWQDTEIAARLIEAGADIHRRHSIGQTVLHVAAVTSKQTDMIQLLLDSGADAEVLDANGNSPMTRAREEGHRASARLLERHVKRQQRPRHPLEFRAPEVSRD